MKTQSGIQKHRKQHISRRANNLSPSGIRKFFDLLSSIDGVISLGVGEPDFTTPWHIREAAIESIEKGQTMYTSNAGMPELRKELARYLKVENGVDYDPASELLITVGASEALDLTMRAILDPGDEVIIPDPSFVAYSSCVVLAEGKPVHLPTYEANNFEISAKDIKRLITPRTRAVLICYPSNPTGAVMSRNKLLEIAELAREYNLTIISDEIYDKLVYGVDYTCFASLPDMKTNTILLGGFSKAFAMTGWRVGYAAAPKEIIAAMTKIHQYTMMCVSTMSQVAAIEALKGDQASVTEMVDDYNRRRLVIVKGLRDIGLSCFEPKGAFYAFPSIRCTGMTSEEFAEKLLSEEKIAVVPGSAFGKCGEGYIRCCYATSLADIEEALKRMGRFVSKYKKT
ncbi:MAG: aminotransferase class I/II-fold pyridoxal phosphate-dependent enzyme [Dehalococcoidales bacterium]|nr:aminotransferase class I/II-fold pyridoxal phosphate-dependent enzyme [Dehalococcoidales bacterium]